MRRTFVIRDDSNSIAHDPLISEYNNITVLEVPSGVPLCPELENHAEIIICDGKVIKNVFNKIHGGS